MENKTIKISLGTLICIFIIILLVIVLIGVSCYYNWKIENINNVKLNTNNDKSINKDNGTVDSNIKEINKLDETKELIYTSYNKASSEYKYSLPYINIDSKDAKKINDEIEMFFKPIIVEQLKNETEDYAITMYEVKYYYYLNDNILSLVISHLHDSDNIFYKIYNLDIYEGTIISNNDILNMKQIKEKEYLNLLKSNYEKKFTELYSNHHDFDNRYKELLNKTISADNYSIETPIFLNEQGKLCVVANIYSFAGADFYKCIIELDINEFVNNFEITNNLKSEDIKYEISTRKNEYDEEIFAVIKAIKDGKTVTEEFEMSGVIAEIETMTLPTIGNVALVADTGGEYYGVNVFQLVNGKIEKLGTIDCGADMVKEATYEVTTKGERTAVITAKRNSENIKKEFEMDAAIAKTEVIDILKCGKVVLVAETGGEYYAFKVFRLSQDYTNGKTQGIIEVGTIQYLF